MRSAFPEPYGPSRPHPAIFVPPRRPRTGGPTRPAPGLTWAERRCDEVVTPPVRATLWRFVRGTAHLLHPGAATPDEPARLTGLNDRRGAGVKIGMLGTDTGRVCLVLRAHLAEPPAGPARPWRHGLGVPGVRPGAVVVSGVDQVAPADVAPLLTEEPSPHVWPWLVVRAAVRDATGTLAVDPGDGLLRPVLDFVVLPLAGPHPPGERPVRCPACDRGRVRRYAAFDLCPDCAWTATA
ncbi:hypothetical protein Asp14428_76990 [Actinoplanes sp. NBRC 14428]|uniref:Uncharacterized protein n=1 Tax=Pseudosporangium ferrugineum TaxID=439699 RepID=A0A2T0RX51_9ACTN|nr:hypothetical protein [Pseudosporangium ferrugineum]PRY25730.1 hypothetical protein CLV70_11296 [Pseudosporangium ferrugineum]BCJ56224.1 hypothetical protein Asp14428_76990 [Actinoplanes sp. NBRC 14428]